MWFSALHHREAFSPVVAGLSLCPDATLSPSPPGRTTLTTGNHKPPGLRARRLRLSQTSSEHLSDLRVGRSPGTTDAPSGVSGLCLQQLTMADEPLLFQPAYVPRPPPTSAFGERLMGSRYGINKVYFYIPFWMPCSIKTTYFKVDV